MTMNADQWDAYRHWLLARGQIWPSWQEQTDSPGLISPNNPPAPANETAGTTPPPQQRLNGRSVVFVAKLGDNPESRTMADNIIRALRLEQDEFRWLPVTSGDQLAKAVQSCQALEANIIVLFGWELSEPFQLSPPLPQSLPWQGQSHLWPNGPQILVVPDLATMVAQPRSKIKVWQLFQTTILTQAD